MSTEENIKKQIEDNKILLYMKGSPDKPQCGFSQRATQILMACGKEFSFVDILSNPDIRNFAYGFKLADFSTVVYRGELIGGSDIMMDMYQSGELKTLIDAVEI